MKKIKVLSLVILAVFIFTVPAYSKELKIGYVDLQRALTQSEPGKSAREKLKEEADVKEVDLTERQEKLKELQSEIDKKISVWNDETRATKEKEFRKKAQEFQDRYVEYEQELSMKEKTTIEELIKGLTKVVKEISRKDGYDYVLEKSAGGIIVAPDNDDITDKVIKAFNSSSK